MPSTTEVEILPDEEYALWEQAVLSAELQSVDRTQSRSLQPEPLEELLPTESEPQLDIQTDQLVAASVEACLPDVEDFGIKLNRRAKHRPRGLRVTDITSAEWCQQLVAFTLSARLPKVRSLRCMTLLHKSRC